MSVKDLSRDQLVELKIDMLCRSMLADGDEPSWGDLANADNLIDDASVYSYFAGVSFSSSDFSD